MTLDEADAKLCRYRDAALTIYARRLLAGGSDIDGQQFRSDLIAYATTLERWRRDAVDHIRDVVRAAAERPSATLN